MKATAAVRSGRERVKEREKNGESIAKSFLHWRSEGEWKFYWKYSVLKALEINSSMVLENLKMGVREKHEKSSKEVAGFCLGQALVWEWCFCILQFAAW